jgi:hypothetical protein
MGAGGSFPVVILLDFRHLHLLSTLRLLGVLHFGVSGRLYNKDSFRLWRATRKNRVGSMMTKEVVGLKRVAYLTCCFRRRNNPVSTETMLWAGLPRNQGSILDRNNRFSLLQSIQTGSGVHSTTYVMSTPGSLTGIERPWREANKSLSTKFEPGKEFSWIVPQRHQPSLPAVPLLRRHSFIPTAGLLLALQR